MTLYVLCLPHFFFAEIVWWGVRVLWIENLFYPLRRVFDDSRIGSFPHARVYECWERDDSEERSKVELYTFLAIVLLEVVSG